MAIIMKENKLKIHAESGEILENDREIGENFYEFLRFQLDESKKNHPDNTSILWKFHRF